MLMRPNFSMLVENYIFILLSTFFLLCSLAQWLKFGLIKYQLQDKWYEMSLRSTVSIILKILSDLNKGQFIASNGANMLGGFIVGRGNKDYLIIVCLELLFLH